MTFKCRGLSWRGHRANIYVIIFLFTTFNILMLYIWYFRKCNWRFSICKTAIWRWRWRRFIERVAIWILILIKVWIIEVWDFSKLFMAITLVGITLRCYATFILYEDKWLVLNLDHLLHTLMSALKSSRNCFWIISICLTHLMINHCIVTV